MSMVINIILTKHFDVLEVINSDYIETNEEYSRGFFVCMQKKR